MSKFTLLQIEGAQTAYLPPHISISGQVAQARFSHSLVEDLEINVGDRLSVYVDAEGNRYLAFSEEHGQFTLRKGGAKTYPLGFGATRLVRTFGYKVGCKLHLTLGSPIHEEGVFYYPLIVKQVYKPGEK